MELLGLDFARLAGCRRDMPEQAQRRNRILAFDFGLQAYRRRSRRARAAAPRIRCRRVAARSRSHAAIERW